MFWNRAQVSEKQALVFFLGGLETEIKNLVKMFEPKSLKQAYNLARLHDNTLTYRRTTPNTLNFLLKQTPTNKTQDLHIPQSPANQLPAPPSLHLNPLSQPYYQLPTGHHSTTLWLTPTPDLLDPLEPERWMIDEPRVYAFSVMRNLYLDIGAKIKNYTHYAL